MGCVAKLTVDDDQRAGTSEHARPMAEEGWHPPARCSHAPQAALGTRGTAHGVADSRPVVPAAAAAIARHQYLGGGKRRHAAARLRRCRRCVALPGRCKNGVAVVSAGTAHLRGPLVLAAPGCQPVGTAARRQAVVAGTTHCFRRLHAHHAGGTHPRSAHAHAVGKTQAAAACSAAGSASGQGRDSGAVSRTCAVWRHHRRRGGCELGVSGQIRRAPVAGRSGLVGGAAAVAKPPAPGPSSRSGATGPRQGTGTHGRARRVVGR
ncbi:hypothetical protein D3C81_950750 [compost metagenome]